MIKAVSFESNNGSIGRHVDDFLQQQQQKHGSDFELIDVKYAMGDHYYDGQSCTSVLIIYKIK